MAATCQEPLGARGDLNRLDDFGWLVMKNMTCWKEGRRKNGPNVRTIASHASSSGAIERTNMTIINHKLIVGSLQASSKTGSKYISFHHMTPPSTSTAVNMPPINIDFIKTLNVLNSMLCLGLHRQAWACHWKHLRRCIGSKR